MERILVGTDGSAGATNAVTWSAHLALALGAELVVTTALALTPTPGAEGPGERDRIARELDTEWCREARAVLATTRTGVLEGDPRVALPDAAVRERADLVVVGSTGTGWFPALHLGHVAHALAHHTDVPLVVVPAVSHPPIDGPVLVGVDGSPGSAAAVAFAGELARALAVDVLAVHSRLGAHPGPSAELEQQVAGWTAPLHAAGVRTRVMVLAGWQAKTISELEATEHPALLVLGTRGAGGFHGLRLGSVGLQLLHRACVPVVLVPPGGARRGGEHDDPAAA